MRCGGYNNGIAGERLHEVCYLGDLNAVKKVIETGVDINVANKVNKWTPLHWAVSQSNFPLVEYLIGEGADRNMENDKGQTPVQLSTSQEIDNLLKSENGVIEENATKTSEFSKVNIREKHGFVPNFIEYPHITYPGREDDHLNESVLIQSREIYVKVRIAENEETDFIELDIDVEGISFEEFRFILCQELQINTKQQSVKKIRKLPNTIVRNEKDIKRLKEGTEVELILIDNQV
ncbi:Ankyrin repeat domain 40 [Oopsacas minuta]|uniref:Ankyrin repeat domain 40 n=1 Tax=Oopsacas minuta TaxID=111878 RepID=A0AAV7K1Q9_9METZ|nr:Ankyrin repeat domain 40 [Oopsacas minuta]